MIIVTGGIKGGSGKTTLCTNLIVLRSRESKRVLLIDADDQRSSSEWVQHRESLGLETKWTTIQLGGSMIYKQISKMKEDYDDIIIDTGGRNTTSQRSALTIADKYIIPFKPRCLDIWTLTEVATLINEIKSVNHRLKCYGVINAADSTGKDNKEAAEIICDYKELDLIIHTIGDRKSFPNAIAEGKGIVEMEKPDLKAVKEMKLLYDSIFLT